MEEKSTGHKHFENRLKLNLAVIKSKTGLTTNHHHTGHFCLNITITLLQFCGSLCRNVPILFEALMHQWTVVFSTFESSSTCPHSCRMISQYTPPESQTIATTLRLDFRGRHPVTCMIYCSNLTPYHMPTAEHLNHTVKCKSLKDMSTITSPCV